MLRIHLPPHCWSERAWICDELFRAHLDIPCEVVVSPGGNVVVGDGHRTLTLPDTFFSLAKDEWLSPATCPSLPLEQWNVAEAGLRANLVDDSVPIIFGRPGFRMDESGNGWLELDVLGSAFFVLSRYEEVVARDRDPFDRFPTAASFAFKAGFWDRPIIDEYAEILSAAMARVWPGLSRKQRVGRSVMSCDVDSAYVCGAKSMKGTIRRLGGDLLVRRSPVMALRGLRNAWRVRRGDYSNDPYLEAIAWMMDVNERAGNRVAFNFIADHSHPDMDGCYSINEPVIRKLLRRIHQRGHEIGLHASFNTYRDSAQTFREAQALRKAMAEEGVHQDAMGGRQHYLRWETPGTARNWEAAGMAYDSTLSYADRPGFRCGTSREFLMYDVLARRPLVLRQRPLVVMESSFIPEHYSGASHETIDLDTILMIKRRCRQFGGDFTLLWHNSNLTTRHERELYEAAVGA